MCCYDGFIISHSIERVELLADEAAKKFVGEYKPLHPLLDVDQAGHLRRGRPAGLLLRAQAPAGRGDGRARAARSSARPSTSRSSTGRTYGSLRDVPARRRRVRHRLARLHRGHAARGGERAARGGRSRSACSSCASSAPSRREELAAALGHLKAVAVLDRSDSFGAFGGPLFLEVRSALFELPKRAPVGELHLRPRRPRPDPRGGSPAGAPAQDRRRHREDREPLRLPPGPRVGGDRRDDDEIFGQPQGTYEEAGAARRRPPALRRAAALGDRAPDAAGRRATRWSSPAPPAASRSSTTIYPYTAWKVPFIHSAFENAAATASRRRGRVPGR